ncbi:DNA cytosine methyltransferase [Aliivibrio sp. S10_S31]|uniref:DNA cytosine methyltransferase n=1 Tax=Aliivibrio sp. S10_S31 TaxID=2720224 RepID=UPI0016812691|nr:DNA cytosine methyltransferase [Aliivibrio sp. S10_S31]MBD1570333.1 DNA cytosine methyltransferase [Aliivibrio sp. S10_S31]
MKVVDLFCGCGGLSLGFEQAGAKILLGIDHNEAALKSFAFNHSGSQTICGDIESITLDLIDQKIGNQKVDVVIGGPPCQGLSLSGPRRYDDPRNRLFRSFVKITKHLNPNVIVLENVPGILSLFKGKIKEEIIKEFQSIGYNVSYKILNAAEFGIPQKRKRAIFIGTKNNIDISFPKPIYTKEEEFISSSDAVSDLFALNDTDCQESMYYKSNPLTEYQKRMRNGVQDGELHNHLITKHTQAVKDTISLVPEGGNYKDLPEELQSTRKFNVAWTRYHSKKPTPTIDTGHRHHFHYKYNRVPTVRENARFQSFPDSFIFLGNKTEQYKQVGNAVPPLLGFYISKEVMKCLSKNT